MPCDSGACGQCTIGATLVPGGAPNPANPCQSCQPQVTATAWSDVRPGSPCANGGAICVSGACTAGCAISNVVYRPGDSSPANACLTCQPDVSISVFSPLTGPAPGGSCGNGSTCYGGKCSSGCSIAGTSYAPGARDPQSPCLGCQPTISAATWSNLDPGTPCGAGGVCSGGVCLYGCEIGGVLFPPDSHNPAQVCQSCQPEANPNGWSPFTGLPANTCVGGQVCLDGGCAIGCYIKRAFYRPGDRKSDDAAQCCGPSDDPSNWSPVFVAGPSVTPYPFYGGQYTVTNGAPQLAAADFDGDGRTDIAFLTNNYSSTIALYLSKVDGGLVGPAFLSAAGTSLGAGDFNGDGYPDLAVSGTDEKVYVLMNLGGGAFASPVEYPANFQGTDAGPDDGGLPINYGPSYYPATGNLVLADVDRDGVLDVVVSGGSFRGVSVLLGIGDGGFQPGLAVPTSTYSSYRVESADFNGDGAPDLLLLGDTELSTYVSYQGVVYASTFTQERFLFLNDGNGTFTQGPPLSLPAVGGSFYLILHAVADFDADGKADLVALFSTTDQDLLEVFTSIGDGGFVGTAPQPATPESYYASPELVVGDFNGDGYPDVFLDPGTLFQNRGDGSLSPSSGPPFSTKYPYAPSGIAADINADGLQDLVVENGYGVVTTWLNNCH